MTRVKICGITSVKDALAAVEAGADALGFVFAPSPRQVTPEQARAICRAVPPFVARVGVVMDQELAALDECGLDAIQFHGREAPPQVAGCRLKRIKAFRIRDASDLAALPAYMDAADAFLLDAYVEGTPGGTGRAFPWELAAEAARCGRPVILAGGLTPENVGEAIHRARPYAVDVSSGVEASPGRKDRAKLRAFLAAVRNADGSVVKD